MAYDRAGTLGVDRGSKAPGRVLSQHLRTQSYWHALEGGLGSEKLLFWEVGAQICASWKFPERLGAWSHGKKRSWGPNIPVQTLTVHKTKQVLNLSSPRVPVRLIGAYYILSSVSEKSSSNIRTAVPKAFVMGALHVLPNCCVSVNQLSMKTGNPPHTRIAMMTS